MELALLLVHLLVCICLTGLVLLQRSEGGALGMGGGGGGALMSGRGAADALAKMTSVAGGFFLVTSLSLTVLSSAGSADADSVFDRILPQSSAPAAPAPAPTAPPADEQPDPTESSIEPSTQLASMSAPAAAPTSAPAPDTAAQRAAPLTPAASTAAPAPTRTAAAQERRPATSTPSTTTQRSGGATTSTSSAERLVLPNTSGAISGVTLEDTETAPESVEVGNGLEAVRRDTRAGPDQ